MKKQFTFYILLTFLLMIFGCDNGITYNNTIDNKAKITVKIFKRDGTPMSGASLIIYNGLNCNYSSKIIEDATNNEGEFKTTLIEGLYSISCQIPEGSLYFSDQRNFMAIGGENLSVPLKPFEQIGNLNFICYKNYNPFVPIANINVALLTKSFNSQELKKMTLNDLLIYKHESKMTDSSGFVSFNNLPLYFTFSVVIYYDEIKWEYTQTYSIGSSNNTQYLYVRI
ncbi:MAG: hypothetical protein EPN82_10800 [Bacteroidetes bacterium]|nr:MAG: hypothetical protein EPN82_10800 [Bacteroidota bacterium]